MNKKIKIITSIIILLLLILLCVKCCGKEKTYVTFTTYNNHSEKLQIKNGLIEKPTDPTREGYTFAGWYYNDELFDFDTKITNDIILVAKWEKISIITYKVTFDSAGGSNVDSQNIEENSKAIRPSNPSKEGYTFVGWYYNDELFDFDTNIAKDITLKAIWAKDEVIDTTKPSTNNSTNNNSNNNNTPTITDTTKPTIDNVSLSKSSNEIIVSVSANDDKTTPNDLKVEYSIDDVNYQTSNIFDGLNQNTDYTVYVKVTDKAGNTAKINKIIKTDKIESPIVESITPNTMTNTDVEIKVKENENYYIQYSLDGITFINYSNKIIVITNGVIKIRYYDGNNYSDVVTETISNIDKREPEDFTPTIVKTTKKLTINGTTLDNVTSAENLTYTYSIDGTNYQASNEFDGLDNSVTYTIYVKVVDEVGNERIVNVSGIILESVPTPIVVLDKTTITNTNVIATISNVGSYTLECKKTGETDYTTCISPVTIESNTTIDFRLTDGINYSEVESNSITNIDKTEPNDFTPTIVKTTKKLTINGTTLDNVTSAENLTYTYSIDGTNYQTSNEFDGLDNSVTYTIYVKVVDEVGNERIVNVSEITLNSVPTPIVVLDKTTITNTNVIATISNVEGYILECKKTGETDYSECTSPVTITNNTTINFRLYDGINYGPIATTTIDYIDKTMPSISITPDGNGTYAKTHSTVVTVTDNIEVATTYYAWSNQNTSEPTFTEIFTSGDTLTNNTDSGNTYLWIKAVDTAGNTKTQVSSAFALDNTNPEISITDTSESSNKISINLVGTDVDSGMNGYYYSISENSTDNYTSKQIAGVYVFTGLKNDTTYYIKVKAVDNVGNEEISNTLTITTANLGAITMSVDNESWSTSKTLTVSNDQVSGEHYYYKVLDDADWTEITTDTFQRTFTSNTSIQFKVTDGTNTEISSFDIDHIDRINPTIDSFKVDTSKIESTSLSFNLTSHDNGEISEKSGIKGYSFSIDNGTTWTAITNDSTHVINDLSPSVNYTIKVRVYDNALNFDEKTMTVNTATNGFIFDPETGIISGINGFTAGSSMIIPSQIDGVTVTEIAANSFKNKDIGSLILPDTLISIGHYAFYRVNLNQETLVIPKNVVSIGNYAFQGLGTGQNIETLIIESDTIDIQQSAFNTGSIQNVVIKGEATLGNSVFAQVGMKTIDLGHTVSIGNSTFYNNPIVQETLKIPSECTSIGTKAFNGSGEYAKNINNLVFDGTNNITILESAFGGGTIKNIDLGNRIADIGKNAFATASVETVDLGKATNIGASAFNGDKLTSVLIPNTVTNIAADSFRNMPTLTSVTVDNADGIVPITSSRWGLATSATITYLR